MPSATEIFEFKANPGQFNIDEAQGIVECFVAAIGNKDSVGDIIIPGAFDSSLRRRNPRVVWGHDWNSPIGKVLEINEVRPGDPRLPAKMRQANVGGLYARVQFNLKSERGRQAFSDVLFFGADQEWSIGYKTLDSVYDTQRQANILKEVELYEVSPVLHGANQLTATISIKSDKPEDKVTSFRKSKWPMFDRSFAEMIRTEYPELWRKGGNIKGNAQYEILSKIAKAGGTGSTDDQIAALELREAWVARHEKDFLLPGVIAQIKWLAIGSRGEKHMKDLVRAEIAKIEDRKKKGLDIEFDSKGDSGNPLTESGEERSEALARALSEKFSGRVRIRVMDENIVVFDLVRDGSSEETMRVSYHYEEDENEFMVGDPERVVGQTVFTPIAGSVGQSFASWPNEEQKAPTPLDAIPQERITGDVLRGYGPRRGNLERLLRYWRPIMRKPGGFRRCLVILANHPELYPLQNICAWLHHETTGLWPNEGCHHPGMKNCRKKIRGVVRGSLWTDDQFDSRLARLANPKKSMIDASQVIDDDEDVVTDMDVKFANMVLKEFMDEEPEFMQFIGDDSNWVHVGDDDGENEVEHQWFRPEGMAGGCNCGCGGKKDNPGDSLLEIIKSADMKQLNEMAELIDSVILGTGKKSGVVNSKSIIEAPITDLFSLREHLGPIINYHKIDCKATEHGLEFSTETLSVDAEKAITNALKSFNATYGKKSANSTGYKISRK
jgi:HK97 family phage prohead protease